MNKSRLEKLEKQGWTARFVAEEPRLSEAVDQYKASGFEVRVECMPKDISCADCPSQETENSENPCRVCFKGFEDQYKLIFTRPCKQKKQKDEDLF
jgi:hypothetical protein